MLHPLDTILHGFSVDIPDGTAAASAGVEGLTDAQKAALAAIQANNEALKAQKTALKDLQAALPGLIGAVLSLKSAQKELHAAEKDTSTSAADLKQKELAVLNAFLGVQSAFGDVIQKYKDGKATVDEVINKFKAQAEKAGLTRQQIRDLIGTVQNYIDKLNNIPSTVTTTARFVGPGSHQQLAEGGIVRRPTFALIGEAGPEAVIPLNRVGGFRRGGDGASLTVNVYVAGSVTADRDLAETVRRELIQIGRRNGGSAGIP
jgi:hypothetical protein